MHELNETVLDEHAQEQMTKAEMRHCSLDDLDTPYQAASCCNTDKVCAEPAKK